MVRAGAGCLNCARKSTVSAAMRSTGDRSRILLRLGQGLGTQGVVGQGDGEGGVVVAKEGMATQTVFAKF